MLLVTLALQSTPIDLQSRGMDSQSRGDGLPVHLRVKADRERRKSEKMKLVLASKDMCSHG